MSHTVAPPENPSKHPGLQVGQHVWISGYNRREPVEGEITKVGRTLVHIRYGSTWQGTAAFRIATGVVNDRYGHDWFYTDEEYAAVERRNAAIAALSEARLLPQPGCSLSLEQLEAVVAVLAVGEANE